MAPVSPYKKLASNVHNQPIRKQHENLAKGKKYVVYQVAKKKSMFMKEGKEYFNMICYFKERNMNWYIYMPSSYDNPSDEDIELFNKHIKDKKPGAICYYGTVGKTNHTVLLEFDEEIDEEKLKAIAEEEEEQQLRSSSKKMKSCDKTDESET